MIYARELFLPGIDEIEGCSVKSNEQNLLILQVITNLETRRIMGT
jgi:hypothetical protein